MKKCKICKKIVTVLCSISMVLCSNFGYAYHLDLSNDGAKADVCLFSITDISSSKIGGLGVETIVSSGMDLADSYFSTEEIKNTDDGSSLFRINFPISDVKNIQAPDKFKFFIIDADGKEKLVREVGAENGNSNSLSRGEDKAYKGNIELDEHEKEEFFGKSFVIRSEDKEKKEISVFKGKTPKLKAYLKESKSDGVKDTLVIKNLYSEKIKIMVKNKNNEQLVVTEEMSDVKIIHPNGSCDIKLKLNSKSNNRSLTSVIVFGYEIGDDDLSGEVSILCENNSKLVDMTNQRDKCIMGLFGICFIKTKASGDPVFMDYIPEMDAYKKAGLISYNSKGTYTLNYKIKDNNNVTKNPEVWLCACNDNRQERLGAVLILESIKKNGYDFEVKFKFGADAANKLKHSKNAGIVFKYDDDDCEDTGDSVVLFLLLKSDNKIISDVSIEDLSDEKNGYGFKTLLFPV